MIELVNSLPSKEELQSTIDELGVEPIELIQYKSAYVLLFEGFGEVGVYFFFTHEYFDGDMIYVGGAGPVMEQEAIQVLREETLLYDDFEISVVAAYFVDQAIREAAHSVTVRFEGGAAVDHVLVSKHGFMINLTEQSYSTQKVISIAVKSLEGDVLHEYKGAEWTQEATYLPGVLR